jgi:hypothetical protein
MREKYFFDTFGYLMVDIPKTDLVDIFERDISSGLNLYFLTKRLAMSLTSLTHPLRAR